MLNELKQSVLIKIFALLGRWRKKPRFDLFLYGFKGLSFMQEQELLDLTMIKP